MEKTKLFVYNEDAYSHLDSRGRPINRAPPIRNETYELKSTANFPTLSKVTQEQGMQTMPIVDSPLEHLEPVLGEAAARYSSAFYMTLKALLNIKVLKEDLKQSGQNLQEGVPCALRNFFDAFVSDEIKTEGLNDLHDALEVVHPMDKHNLSCSQVLVAVLEFWHYWKSPERESLVTRLFTLEEYETMRCTKCQREPNYPEQTSYGIVVAADSIRRRKYACGVTKFVDVLKLIRMEEKRLCDIKTGGCGETNFVHHVMSKCPPIFTIVLGWEKNETVQDISKTTKALEWEIDMSRLYEGLPPNTKYRLVSMVGCGEEEEHICLAYRKKLWWVSFRHEALAEAVVGEWEDVARLCGERKVRLEILFFQPTPSYAELAAPPPTAAKSDPKPRPRPSTTFSVQPPKGQPSLYSKTFVNQRGFDYFFKSFGHRRT